MDATDETPSGLRGPEGNRSKQVTRTAQTAKQPPGKPGGCDLTNPCESLPTFPGRFWICSSVRAGRDIYP